MKIASEILILIMLIMNTGRVMTLRKPNRDPLVMLAPLAFLLASLSLFAFSADVFLISILILSFFILLSNFHALIRYSSHLIIDRYSILMKIWAWITFILAVGLLLIIIIFRPVNISDRNHNITITTENYSGNFSRGFVPAERFNKSTGFVSEFKNKDAGDDNTVILFISDKRGDTEFYKPFLIELADSGITTVSADFYARDVRWLHTLEDSRIFRRLGLVLRSLINNQNYKFQREFYTFNFSREIETMVPLLEKKYGTEISIFLVTDEMGVTAAEDYINENPKRLSGIFDLSSVPEYKTPGYGFIEQTDPFLGKILGVKRDNSQKAINACVAAVTESIKNTNKE